MKTYKIKTEGKYQRKDIEYFINQNECHICISHPKNKPGYPMIGINGKSISVARYLYKTNIGEIPKGLVIRHKCDNPNCINVNHLVVGTFAENMQDRKLRNRTAKMQNNGRCKLNPAQVISIRKSYLNPTDLSKKYKVSRGLIYQIKQYKIWKDL